MVIYPVARRPVLKSLSSLGWNPARSQPTDLGNTRGSAAFMF